MNEFIIQLIKLTQNWGFFYERKENIYLAYNYYFYGFKLCNLLDITTVKKNIYMYIFKYFYNVKNPDIIQTCIKSKMMLGKLLLEFEKFDYIKKYTYKNLGILKQ